MSLLITITSPFSRLKSCLKQLHQLQLRNHHQLRKQHPSSEESTSAEGSSSTADVQDSTNENNCTLVMNGASAATAAVIATVVKRVYFGLDRGRKGNLTVHMPLKIKKGNDDAVLWDGIDIEPEADRESYFTYPKRQKPVRHVK